MARRHTECLGNACAWSSTEGKADGLKGVGEPDRAPLAGSHKRGKTLGKNLLATAVIAAAKAPHGELKRHRCRTHGAIGKAAAIATMNGRRWGSTGRTRCDEGGAMGRDLTMLRLRRDRINGYPTTADHE